MRGYLKRFWRRPQFSLAAFMVVVALFSVPFAYVQYRRAWNMRRMEARRALVRLGYQLDSKSTNPYQYRWRMFLDTIFLEDGYQALQVYQGWGHLPSQPSPEFDFFELQYFPELESIALGPSPKVNDEVLEVVAILPHLDYLSVSGVSGSFLQRLPANSKIETLRIRRITKPSPIGLARINGLSKLKVLEIGASQNLEEETLQEVVLPKSVEELVLVDCKIDDLTLIRWLTQCKFKKLRLCVPMTRLVAGALSRQSELEELDIQAAPLVDEDFTFLSNCKRLKVLRLRDVPVRGEFLGRIACPENFEELELIGTQTPESRVRSFWENVRRRQGMEMMEAEVADDTNEKE